MRVRDLRFKHLGRLARIDGKVIRITAFSFDAIGPGGVVVNVWHAGEGDEHTFEPWARVRFLRG